MLVTVAEVVPEQPLDLSFEPFEVDDPARVVVLGVVERRPSWRRRYRGESH